MARVNKVEKKRGLELAIPNVTEDDLLRFQLAHFNDDSVPSTWFVDRETALSCSIESAELDDLGYYEDGTKRTLTDEQIAIFRHSEIQHMIKEGKLREDEYGETIEARSPTLRSYGKRANSSGDGYNETSVSRTGTQINTSAPSLRQQGALASKYGQKLRPASRQPPPRKQRETESSAHKRTWDEYVTEIDPVEGPMTARRVARELDELRQESVDLDY